jgi:L-lysine exporter family protein LysE/ArgO
MTSLFIYSTILAFGLITPIGIVNLYVIQQGIIQRNLIRNIPVIVGAGLADTLLIAASVTGVSVLIMGIPWLHGVMLLAGIGFLLVMGVLTWRAKPSEGCSEQADKSRLLKQGLYIWTITVFNPHAIVDTVGVIGTASLQFTGTEKVAFTVTTILVSWVWYFGLAVVGRLLGNRFRSQTFLIRLNRFSACVMWAAASYIIWTSYISN